MAFRDYSYINTRATSQGVAGRRSFIIACSIAGAGVLLTVTILLGVYIRRHHRQFGPVAQLKLLLPSVRYNTNHSYETSSQVTKPPPCILPSRPKPLELTACTLNPAPRYLHPPSPPSFHNRSPPGFRWKRKCPPRLGPLLETGPVAYTTTTNESEKPSDGVYYLEPKEYDSKEFRGSLDEVSTITNHLNRSPGYTRTVFAHTYADESHNLMDNLIPSPSLYFSTSIDLEALMFPPDINGAESCLLSRSRTKSSSVILLPGSSPESKKNSSGASKPLRVTASVISRWRRVRDVIDSPKEEMRKGGSSFDCSISPTWSEHGSFMSSLRIGERIDE